MINSDLCIISRWFQANKLSLNVGKTSFVIFHPAQSKNPQLNVALNSMKIRESLTVKFLKVLLHQHLNWKAHVENVRSKASRIVGIFHKIKLPVPQNILQSFYYTLVYPHLSYCNILWGNTHLTYSRLFLLQKKLICLISSSSYRDHTALLFTEFEFCLSLIYMLYSLVFLFLNIFVVFFP